MEWGDPLQIDLDYLRRHYASLSDEALLAIDRAELVGVAQACYDEELARREAALRPSTGGSAGPHMSTRPLDGGNEEEDAEYEPGGEATPKWLDEAACVATFVSYPGTDAAPDATNARDVLEAAGIPCYVAFEEIPPERPSPHPQPEYRVMVPGARNLQAVSVLDQEIFNSKLEAEWAAHLAELSDEELRSLDPEIISAGLSDRIERLKKAYSDEIASRRLRPRSAEP